MVCRGVTAGRCSALLHSSLPASSEHMQRRALHVELPLALLGTRDRYLSDGRAFLIQNLRHFFKRHKTPLLFCTRRLFMMGFSLVLIPSDLFQFLQIFDACRSKLFLFGVGGKKARESD